MCVCACLFSCVWPEMQFGMVWKTGQECVYLRADVFRFLSTAASDLNMPGMSWCQLKHSWRVGSEDRDRIKCVPLKPDGGHQHLAAATSGGRQPFDEDPDENDTEEAGWITSSSIRLSSLLLLVSESSLLSPHPRGKHPAGFSAGSLVSGQPAVARTYRNFFCQDVTWYSVSGGQRS